MPMDYLSISGNTPVQKKRSFFLLINRCGGVPLCGGELAPHQGGESGKNGFAEPFLRGGTACPPSEGEKPALGGLEGRLPPLGGCAIAHMVAPPSGGAVNKASEVACLL